MAIEAWDLPLVFSNDQVTEEYDILARHKFNVFDDDDARAQSAAWFMML